MLRDKTWRIRYTPDDGDLVRLFYIPALQDAVRYHRLTGYFSAGALALAARGIEELVRNSGQVSRRTFERRLAGLDGRRAALLEHAEEDASYDELADVDESDDLERVARMRWWPTSVRRSRCGRKRTRRRQAPLPRGRCGRPALHGRRRRRLELPVLRRGGKLRHAVESMRVEQRIQLFESVVGRLQPILARLPGTIPPRAVCK